MVFRRLQAANGGADLQAGRRSSMMKGKWALHVLHVLISEHALVSRALLTSRWRWASDPVKLVSNKDLEDQEVRIYSLWRHHSVICKYRSLLKQSCVRRIVHRYNRTKWLMVLLICRTSIHKHQGNGELIKPLLIEALPTHHHQNLFRF